VQALRFVDVLPALYDDRELTRHLHKYFGEEGFPLPPLVAFGVRHVQVGIATTPFGGRAIRKSLGQARAPVSRGAKAEEARRAPWRCAPSAWIHDRSKCSRP